MIDVAVAYALRVAFYVSLGASLRFRKNKSGNKSRGHRWQTGRSPLNQCGCLLVLVGTERSGVAGSHDHDQVQDATVMI